MYDLDTIQATIERALGVTVSKSRLKMELEKPTWVPETGRMIAVSETMESLPTADRYGMFQGMTEKNEYQIAAGRYKYARVLTAEELAQCY